MIVVSPDAPTADSASVISIYNEVCWLFEKSVNGMDEQLKANGFSPSNVSLALVYAPVHL